MSFRGVGGDEESALFSDFFKNQIPLPQVRDRNNIENHFFNKLLGFAQALAFKFPAGIKSARSWVPGA